MDNNEKNIKYYKTSCDKLIQFSNETLVYKIRNNIEHIDTRLSKEEFDNLDKIEIKRTEFSMLMNIFFKNVDHSWVYEGAKFKKLPNFEADEYRFSTNYDLGKQVPYHKIDDYEPHSVFVYHWGRIYFHTISYGGYPQGHLVCPKTKEIVRWAKLKHCAPVINLDTNKIV